MPDTRKFDGSAGEEDYGKIGRGDSGYRQPDPTIAAELVRALGGRGRS